MVVLSEGAEWEGYQLREYGEADAFGHRKKANVGEDLSDEIKKATGQETVVSDLTYELRSGSPDFVDKLVASTFASMAMDCIAKGEHGMMTAINHGCYAMEPIPDPNRVRAMWMSQICTTRNVPAQIRGQAGAADLPDPAVGGRWGELREAGNTYVDNQLL